MNLIEGLMKKMSSIRDLVRIYEELPGGAGMIGAMMIRQDIEAAERAIASGDVVAMLRAYKTLDEIKD